MSHEEDVLLSVLDILHSKAMEIKTTVKASHKSSRLL